MVELLIENGADTNAKDTCGEPLISSASMGLKSKGALIHSFS